MAEPVLQVYGSDGFALWAVAESDSYGLMPLTGALQPIEIGTAVRRIAQCNDIDPEHDEDRPPRPADPLAGFLHGLLTMDDLYASGGLRFTDTASGTVLVPGCCTGLEEWRGWLGVVDGEGDGAAEFGHDPAPRAERLGDTVRLTVDADRDDGPVIELPVTELGRLLASVERDLTAFLATASLWATRHLPHATPVTAALARALDLPGPER
ncbi:hypothetical protein [Streptomyces sp. NPDC060366]|uniref:hypothetical protein n=1 Tax=Streptomyces sp. NPDC060366 TaxID=3347105 RepID=UPI00365C0D60